MRRIPLLPEPARAETGASAVEYGLLLAAIAAVIIAVVFALGGALSQTYGSASTCLSATSTATC